MERKEANMAVLSSLLLCLDFEVVVDDEEVDGVEVALDALGEGIGLAHQPAHPRSQRAKEAFCVVGLAFGFVIFL
jgi:hypothetical protein